MSTRLNLNTVYVTAAMILTLTSCSITKNMVWVNGRKDLEQRCNTEKILEAQIDNVQRGMNYAYRDFEKKTLPYQTLINNNKPYELGHPYNLINK